MGFFHFYNTNKETRKKYLKSVEKAISQEEIIMSFFNKNKDASFTPFEIQETVLKKAPITSVRRAITNLTNQGKLRKFSLIKEGRYGKNNHTWIYNKT